MDNIIIQGSNVEISELESHPDYLSAKFIICDFNTNKNGVRLNRDTIEGWMESLVDAPLVGKIAKNANNVEDFTSHNLKIVSKKGKDGKFHKQAEFDTSAFGVFTSVEIEKINDVEYIVAEAKIWKRFSNAVKVIQNRIENGSLSTSWEVSVEDATLSIEDGKLVKVINDGRFTAHCLLGESVEPAYDESGLLEVASKDESNELNTALVEDIKSIETSSDIKNLKDKEDATDMEENNIVEDTNEVEISEEDVVEPEVQDTASEEPAVNVVEEGAENSENNDIETNVEESQEEPETSALTTNDLRRKLEDAYRTAENDYAWVHMMFPADNTAWFKGDKCESELDYIEVKYSVENDEVKVLGTNPIKLIASPREINQVIAQKDSAIVEMSKQIQTLNDSVASLQPYKDKVDEIEKAEKEAQFIKDKEELTNYAISSGHISKEEVETSEEIKGYIESLDKASIKSLIADRVVSSMNQTNETEVETSESHKNPEANVTINLNSKGSEKSDIDVVSAVGLIRNFISK